MRASPLAPPKHASVPTRAMASKLIENVRIDLLAVGDYLRSITAERRDEALQSQSKAFVARLRLFKNSEVPLAEITNLRRALQDGPWTPEQLDTIEKAILDLPDDGASKNIRRAYQY